MAHRRHRKSRSSRKFGLVKNTVSTVKNVGDKSIHLVKNSIGEVVAILKDGASLTADGVHTGIQNTTRFLKKKPRTRKNSRKGKKGYSRKYRK